MNCIAIADHFKWGLSDVKNLTIKEYNGVMEYLKKLKEEQKKSERKAKAKSPRRHR